MNLQCSAIQKAASLKKHIFGELMILLNQLAFG